MTSVSGLPLINELAKGKNNKRRSVVVTAFALIASLGLLASLSGFIGNPATNEDALVHTCPFVQIVRPENNSTLDIFKTAEYRNGSLSRFQKALSVPTEVFDDLKEVGDDPRWDVFFEFRNVLEELYPLLHKKLTLETVNTHGLIYTWDGSDASLEPIMLMAHQDVVPVLPDTLDLWTYPPYSAFFDGEYVHARGAFDCKNMLIGIMDAVTQLLEDGFSPKRSVVLSFGFDEEASGRRGAGHNSKFLEEKYGVDYPFYSILDEGMGNSIVEDVLVAFPMVAEKGYLDVEITIHTAGGHSSMPPDHTGIGKLAQLISLIENTPHPKSIDASNPTLQALKCIAAHSHTMPKVTKDAIFNCEQDTGAQEIVLDLVQSWGPSFANNVYTTQAVDIVRGGLKINALPEQVILAMNHRIDVHQTMDDIYHKLIKNTIAIAAQYDMAVVYNGTYYYGSPECAGYFEIAEYAPGVNPSPTSPSSGKAWDLIAGTIRHVFEEFATPMSDTVQPIVVAPQLLFGITDTKYYWNLSKNIYRYAPVKMAEVAGYHTVDEKISLSTHIESTVWYYEYLQVASSS